MSCQNICDPDNVQSTEFERTADMSGISLTACTVQRLKQSDRKVKDCKSKHQSSLRSRPISRFNGRSLFSDSSEFIDER